MDIIEEPIETPIEPPVEIKPVKHDEVITDGVFTTVESYEDDQLISKVEYYYKVITEDKEYLIGEDEFITLKDLLNENFTQIKDDLVAVKNIKRIEKIIKE